MCQGCAPMSETNGQSKSRLDRIEEMIERQERANEAAHARFEAEDQRLLTAQILMHDAMKKVNDSLAKAEETTNAAVARAVMALQKTNVKLDALIARLKQHRCLGRA